MTDEKKIAGEMLTDEQLNGVSGGTSDETKAIIDAIGNVTREREIICRNTHGMEIGRVFRQENDKLSYEEVEGYLKKNYGIDADISTGFLFYGGRSNKYSKNGQNLTHQQVLDIIRGK